MAKPLQIKVDVDSSGAASGLKVVADGVEGATYRMRTALKSADASTGGFIRQLQDMRREEMQSSRAVSFLTQELSAIGPISGEAASGLQGVLKVALEGAAGGGAFAVAFESAKQVLEGLAREASRAEEQFRALRQATQESFVRAADGLRALDDQLRSGRLGAALTAWEKAGAAANKQIAELQQKIEDIERGSRGTASGVFQDVIAAVSGGALAQSTDDQVRALREQIAAIRAGREEARPVLDAARANERAREYAATNREIVAIESQTASEIQRIRADLASKLDALGGQSSSERAAALRIALEASAAEQIRRLKVDAELGTQRQLLDATRGGLTAAQALAADFALRTSTLTEQLRRADTDSQRANIAAVLAATRAQYDAQERLLVDSLARRQLALEAQRATDAQSALQRQVEYGRALEAQNERLRSQAEQLAGLFAPVTNALGASLDAMLSGTKSATEAIKSMFEDMAKAIIAEIARIATKWLILNTITSIFGGGLFGSVGLGSILGIDNLIGAKGAAGGVTSLSSIAAAGVSAASSMSVSPSYSISISAMDGASVRRVVESGEFAMALREASRNGRL